MNRAGPLRRSGPLGRSTRIRRVSARRRAELEQLVAFRAEVLRRARGKCERCGSSTKLHAHHLVSRARGRGWEGLHQASNGAALCGPCHDEVHHGTPHDRARWHRGAPRGTQGAARVAGEGGSGSSPGGGPMRVTRTALKLQAQGLKLRSPLAPLGGTHR